MTGAIPIAVTCCPECRAAYDLEELRELEDVGRRERDGMVLESRRCQCGAEFSTRTDGLEQLQLYTRADEYLATFGTDRAHRVIVAPPEQPNHPLLKWAVLVAIMAAVAVLVSMLSAWLGWW